MYLDNATIRNLELLNNIILQSENSTLLGVLDKTKTPMGKRLIKRWIISPLIDKDSIQNVYDIERLIARVAYGNANPKDLVALKQSLAFLPKIKELLEKTKSFELQKISKIPDLEMARKKIQNAIKDEPNTIIREGNIIRNGYNSELDELRELTHNTKKYLTELEERERQRSGIKSLKINYNRVFGYYIEITKSNLHLVPEDYIRKQTQVNSERFITEELKEKESKILGAEERIFELEQELFFKLLEDLKQYIPQIQLASKIIAKLDCFISFAIVSEENNYCKPSFNSYGILEIESLAESVHTMILFTGNQLLW